MQHPIIEKAIFINALPENVWRVFTDPSITKQMGGEYVSEWKVGSTLGWKGPDGNMYTHGTILQLENAKLLQHNLVDMNDHNILLSVITYELEPAGNATTLHAKEELHYETSHELLQQVNEGWDFALQMVKDIAEKL